MAGAQPPGPGSDVALVGPATASALEVSERGDERRRIVEVRPRRRLPAYAWLAPVGLGSAVALVAWSGLLAFEALRVAVLGCALGLLGLQIRLGRLHVAVDADEVRVTRRPLPARRPIVERTQNVEGFHVAERFAPSAIGGRDDFTWVVELRTRDGRVLELPLRLPQRDHAEQVAVRLNRALLDAQTPRTYRG